MQSHKGKTVSFNELAKHLNISQPSISHYMRRCCKWRGLCGSPRKLGDEQPGRVLNWVLDSGKIRRRLSVGTWQIEGMLRLVE